MAIKGVSKKEEAVLKKIPIEQYKYFKKVLMLNIVCTILAIPLYVGGGFLFMKIGPDKDWMILFAFLILLVFVICFAIAEIIRITKIIKKLKKENPDLK